jgi:hypothetical protein
MPRRYTLGPPFATVSRPRRVAVSGAHWIASPVGGCGAGSGAMRFRLIAPYAAAAASDAQDLQDRYRTQRSQQRAEDHAGNLDGEEMEGLEGIASEVPHAGCPVAERPIRAVKARRADDWGQNTLLGCSKGLREAPRKEDVGSDSIARHRERRDILPSAPPAGVWRQAAPEGLRALHQVADWALAYPSHPRRRHRAGEKVLVKARPLRRRSVVGGGAVRYGLGAADPTKRRAMRNAEEARLESGTAPATSGGAP